MSILDAATNQAINKVIDLHQQQVLAGCPDGSEPIVRCGHCSGLPGAILVPYPCPTIQVLTAAAETTMPT